MRHRVQYVNAATSRDDMTPRTKTPTRSRTPSTSPARKEVSPKPSAKKAAAEADEATPASEPGPSEPGPTDRIEFYFVEPDIVEQPRPDAPYLQYLAAHAKYIEAVQTSVQPSYDHGDVRDVTTSILAADFLLPKILHPGDEDEARKAAEEAAEAVAAAEAALRAAREKLARAEKEAEEKAAEAKASSP